MCIYSVFVFSLFNTDSIMTLTNILIMCLLYLFFHSLATSILGQMMLEQRHKMAMEQLSREMQQEMQKQREELNRELEMEMKIELEVGGPITFKLYLSLSGCPLLFPENIQECDRYKVISLIVSRIRLVVF